jgi:TonB family protein
MVSHSLRTLLLLVSVTGCAALAPWRLRARGARPLPVYPAELSALGFEGEAAVRLYVLPGGALDHARTRVLRASHAPFAASTMEALRQWQTSPVGADSVQVQVYFAVDRDARCSASSSVARQDSRATLEVLNGGLRIIVHAWTCASFRTVSDRTAESSAQGVT